jgi:divalent metal cation (Fe/Co/Zn/Cd) transporter
MNVACSRATWPSTGGLGLAKIMPAISQKGVKLIQYHVDRGIMASRGSKTVIYAALASNMLIAVFKFAAAWFTGSSAMLSEAVHSLVDTGNQGLLLHGIRQATKAASAEHPFGHGLQLYFWTFIVAILIFGLGAGVAVLEGIEKILAPRLVESPWVNYGVLALSCGV